MSTATPQRRPTRLGTALVLVVTLLATAALVVTTGRVEQVLVGALGAVALAAALLALDQERFEVIAVTLAALVLPLVGIGLVVGVGDTIADQIRGQLPVGSAVLVAGATVAVFGAVTALRDVLRRETVVRTLKIGVAATTVVASVLCVLATVHLTPTGRQIEDAVGAGVGVVLEPASGRVHLGVLLAVTLTAGYGLRAALLGLPVSELVGHRLRTHQREWLRRIERTARTLAAPLAVLTGFVLVVEQVGSPYAGAPRTAFDLLAGLTGSGLLRWLLVALAVVSWALAGLGWLVRRTYRFSGHDALVRSAPYLSGIVLATVTVVFETSIVSTLRRELTIRVPPSARPRFRELSASVVEFYGETVLALAAVLVVLLVALAALLALALVVVFGVAPRRATGPALAAGGLFTAAAFAAVILGSLPLGLVGIVASLLVWDAGEYAATLGRELGTDTPTARTELVHVGATLLVGTVAAAVALAVEGFAGSLDAGSVPVVPALVLSLIGALFLVVASR